MLNDVNPEDIVNVVDKSTRISVGKTLLFDYNHEEGILGINISEEFFLNLGSSEIPVDLCFPIPDKQNEHYCFKKVNKIIRIEQKQGLVKRFTKFLFG